MSAPRDRRSLGLGGYQSVAARKAERQVFTPRPSSVQVRRIIQQCSVLHARGTQDSFLWPSTASAASRIVKPVEARIWLRFSTCNACSRLPASRFAHNTCLVDSTPNLP